MASPFEYILDPGRLSQDLNCCGIDTAHETILLFLQNAQTYREGMDGGTLISLKDRLLTKKSVALRILALKAAAYLRWNITSEEFRDRIPNYLQKIMVLDLLAITSGELEITSEHSSLALETLMPENIFALSLYHRWVLVNAAQQDVLGKQKPAPQILGPLSAIAGLKDPALASHLTEVTQRQTTQKVDESCEILEKLLLCRTPYMPTSSAFIPPNPHGRDMTFDSEQVMHIRPEEYQLQLRYDLGCYYMFKKKHSQAAEHFRSAAVIFNSVDSALFDFCSIQERKLIGYLTACELTTKNFSKPQERLIVEKLHESLKNNYRGLLDILHEDNQVRQLPIHTRDTLELDLIGSASSGILLDSEHLMASVSLLNVVRRVIDGVPSSQNIDNFVLDEMIAGARTLLRHFEDVFQSVGIVERFRIKNFLHRYCLDRGPAGKAVLKAMTDSKLNVLFTSEQLTDLEEGRFVASEPPETEKNNEDLSTDVGKASALQRLIASYDIPETRELISTIGRLAQGKQVWMLSMRWEIPIPFQSTIMGLPKGLIQDFAYISLAKSRELLNQEEYALAQSFISAIEDDVRPLTIQQNVQGPQPGFPLGPKLLLMLQWESNMIDCVRAIKEWPKRRDDERNLIKNCKYCLSTLSGEFTNAPNVLPRSEVIEHLAALLLACGEWDFLIPLTNVNRFVAASLEYPATLAAASLELARNRERPNRVIANALWELVSSAFAKAPMLGGQKRGNTGAVVADNTAVKSSNLTNFCSRLCEPVTLSVMISCLCQLYNIVRDESGLEVTIEYIGFWPPNVPNPSGYHSHAIHETLQLVVERGLKLHPSNHTWLRIMGDLNFAQNNYNAAMRWYLEACSSASDYFSLPVPKSVMDDFLVKRMVRCCQKMQKLTEAAILCQFLEPPDYAVAFKSLQEKSSCDGMDALYPCIWDMAILEFLTAQYTKRGEPKREDAVLQTGLLELNSNNNEEIQREAMNQRKAKFLRGLAREYIIL